MNGINIIKDSKVTRTDFQMMKIFEEFLNSKYPEYGIMYFETALYYYKVLNEEENKTRTKSYKIMIFAVSSDKYFKEFKAIPKTKYEIHNSEFPCEIKLEVKILSEKKFLSDEEKDYIIIEEV